MDNRVLNSYLKPDTLSDKERDDMLKKMMSHAQTHEEERISRLQKKKEIDLKEVEKESVKKTNKEELVPNFLNEMGRQVYTDETTSTVEDRVKRNIYYVQKSRLDERGMF